MTRIILGILAGIALGAAATWTALRRGQHEEKKTEEEHKEDSRILHTNDQTFVKLDKEAQEKVGLQLAALEAASLPREVNVTGRVLDPAPLAAVISERAIAQAMLDASRKELERLKVLAEDKNTSARLLETAAAAVQRDQIALDTAQLKLVAGWGGALARQKDLPALVASLAAQEAALVRLDVQLGDAPGEMPAGARIAAFDTPDAPLDAQFLGPAPNADPQTQGRGFLCLVKSGSPAPGSAVTGWLVLPGPPEQGVLIPRSAIVRHESEAFVYVQTGAELFLRKEVELHHPTTKGWFASEGFRPGDKVVTVGAQQMLSEELKGEAGEE
jgi:hypothetical protein